MSFVNDMINNGELDDLRLFNKSSQNACTYPDFFNYWRENLFERLMRLFIWECGDLEQKEIEQRLILAGHCGIADYKGDLTAFFGSFFGVTVYQDEWTNYNVHSPIYSNTYKINKNLVVINNNSLRNATFHHVTHYAALLAHAEVTLMMELVEARDSGGVPIATTEKVKQSMLSYQAKRFNGKIGVVMDSGGIGAEYMGVNRNTNHDVTSIWDVRTRLMKSFYADIGVRATFDKRSNTVVDEVTSDSSMLLYNVSDMLYEREQACKRINDLFGVNWSVKLSEEIDYTDNNEPEQRKAVPESEEVSVDV